MGFPSLFSVIKGDDVGRRKCAPYGSGAGRGRMRLVMVVWG